MVVASKQIMTKDDPKKLEKATNDVDAMEDVETVSEEQKALDAANLLLSEIRQNVALIEKGVAQVETRFLARAIRNTALIRHRLTPDLLFTTISNIIPKDSPAREALLSNVSQGKLMEVKEGEKPITFSPEVEVYLAFLVILYLHDQGDNVKGGKLATEYVEKIHSFNRRTLDQIAARIFFYYSRFYEIAGKLSECRPTLLQAHRTATLRRDDESQATLVNLLLRNYLHYNLVDQADKLVSKTTFPDVANNNQVARYMYYLGVIKAIQLDYTASHQHLQQAVRKAPQNASAAGFNQAVHKMSIIVQLLTGDIPDKSVFRQPFLQKSLEPYLHLTQAVRVGDLSKFQEVLNTYGKNFRADQTYTLILRLRHNVIKTGVRMISLSYSRISLKDICLKLHLDSEEDAEYIVAKAIRDGVIDATIDHEKGFVKSKETLDIYSTNEPLAAFDGRISYCLNLHNDSVKAMRFPSNAYRKELGAMDELRQEEAKLATEIVDGELDDDDDAMDF